MSRLQSEIDASWDMDACECGEVYRIADGHRCNARVRLRRQHEFTSAPFTARPVQHVLDEARDRRAPSVKRTPKAVPRRRDREDWYARRAS